MSPGAVTHSTASRGHRGRGLSRQHGPDGRVEERRGRRGGEGGHKPSLIWHLARHLRAASVIFAKLKLGALSAPKVRGNGVVRALVPSAVPHPTEQCCTAYSFTSIKHVVRTCSYRVRCHPRCGAAHGGCTGSVRATPGESKPTTRAHHLRIQQNRSVTTKRVSNAVCVRYHLLQHLHEPQECWRKPNRDGRRRGHVWAWCRLVGGQNRHNSSARLAWQKQQCSRRRYSATRGSGRR